MASTIPSRIFRIVKSIIEEFFDYLNSIDLDRKKKSQGGLN